MNGIGRVPLAVHVHDFALPKEARLRSSLGLDEGSVNRYHGLTNPAQRQIVYEKYLENCKRHRISPYSFFAYAPMDIRFEGEGAAKRARVDFTRFDQAASRWLGPGGFNSFVLPLRGMGGGSGD